METGKSAYMLLFRGTEWHKGLSPEEMQRVSEQWMNWFQGLAAEGIAISGNPLEMKGKVVSGKNATVSADGPFAETKEMVAGYFMLMVANEDEAVEIAKKCPGLPYGAVVEVRPVAPSCPLACAGELSPGQKELAHA